MSWLIDNPDLVLQRFALLRDSLCLRAGDTLSIADFGELRWDERLLGSGTTGERLGGLLHQFLDEWCRDLAPTRWQRQSQETIDGKQHPVGFSLEQFQSLASYLRDYLVRPDVCCGIVQRLTDIVTIRLRDEAAARQARRKYTSMVLNDAILYLGPPHLLVSAPHEPSAPASGPADGQKHGGQGPRLAPAAQSLRQILEHLHRHLADCLAAGAGEEAMIPPGNHELCDLIEEWD